MFMKKITLFLTTIFIITHTFSQTIANVEGVFGGSINSITGGSVGSSSDSFRIIIATQSANSIFYSNVIIPSLGGSVLVDSFKVLPAASSASGFGSGISKIAYHKSSNTVFFISNGNIYSASLTATSAKTITTNGGYTDIAIKNNQLFEMHSNGSNNTFYAGNIDVTGAITIISSATIVGQSFTNLIIGKDDKLYAFRANNDPQAIQFGGTFSTAINLSSTTIDAMPSLSVTTNWAAMGVYTDGTVFVGGNDAGGKNVATAISFGNGFTTVATGIPGNSGTNIDFRRQNASNYFVYFGSAYSSAKGATGSWQNFGSSSFQTHPNDGSVFFVGESITTGGVVLMTTDQGLGITKNSGSVIAEIDEGINAVQVKDFDMNATKDFGWLASKSGIRYVENYNNISKAWSKAIFPNNDGSPYYAAEMISKDTAFVGNSRVYKTTDKGNNWTQVFTAQNAPYNFPQTGVFISSIAVGGTNNSIVMAGYKFENTNSGRGGVFYSMNGGNSWQQLRIHATVDGQDVNVNDIEMVTDSGKVVAYIGVAYDNSVSPMIRGMYKAQWNGTAWSIKEENIYNSSTALFSVKDIMIVSKDTIVAAGSFYNASLHHEYPIHFAVSRTVKNNWSSAVVDTSRVGGYSAITWSGDTIFYAYNNSIYWDKLSFYATYTARKGEALYYSVPLGTDINILYYDELLAGTETDIRSVRGATTKKPTTAIKPRYTVCTQTVITGGTPEGGVYYLVDTTAQGYIVAVDTTYYLLFATNGILTGESSMSFNTLSALNSAFASLHIVNFTPITSFSNNTGTYIIAYTNDSYATSSDGAVATVGASPTVASITGTLASCGPLGATSYLANATANGVWTSANNNIATVSSSGKITVSGVGTTVISYTVTNSSGCSGAAIANFTVSPVPFVSPITGVKSICKGNSTQLNSATIGGAWSSLNNRGTITATGLFAGINGGGSPAQVRYTVTNSSGCSTSQDYFLVVNSLPVVPSIYYANGSINPQIGAGGVSNFCSNKTFTLAGLPKGGIWSATGVINIHSLSGNATTGSSAGSGSVTYTYTSPQGCSNSKTIVGNVVACVARGVNGIDNEKLTMENEFTMYPIPAHSLFTIHHLPFIGAGNIVITDLYGKQVKVQPLSVGNNLVDITTLTKGVYCVSTITNQGKTTKKLVVE